MCSRASRRVAESRSFWETACCELALGLEDLLLERADPLGGVLEAAAEHDDLFLEALELALEVVDLPLVLGETPVVLGSHAVTSSGLGDCLASDTTPGLRCPGHFRDACRSARPLHRSAGAHDFSRLGLRNPSGRVYAGVGAARRDTSAPARTEKDSTPR